MQMHASDIRCGIRCSHQTFVVGSDARIRLSLWDHAVPAWKVHCL